MGGSGGAVAPTGAAGRGTAGSERSASRPPGREPEPEGNEAREGAAGVGTWRFFAGACDGSPLRALEGAANMALDELLLRSVAGGGGPALRLYRWAPACLSLGRNQVARGELDASVLEAHGVHLVRRPTGGTAVLHDAELTYSVAVPVGLVGSPRETYGRVNAALAAALGALGVSAELALSGGAAGPRGRPVCFAAPASGEITAAGRKLVGSAQRREGRTLLQHGSILLDGDQDLVRAAFRDGPAAAPVATLRQVLGRIPSTDALAAHLERAFEAMLGIRLAPAALSRTEREGLPALESWYRSAAWTWRR